MLHPIYPCLWFDTGAAEAADWYTGIFPDSSIKSQNSLVTYFTLAGQDFLGLNGGPHFSITPGISFMVLTDDEALVKHLWDHLAMDGKTLMPLGSYPWSRLYGWCSDKYGVNWQIMCQDEKPAQMIVPSLMFTRENSGKAEEAIMLYTSLFDTSEVVFFSRYGDDAGDMAGQINHGRFRLLGREFNAFDGGKNHAFGFNEGISLVVMCDTQEEINRLWSALSEGGIESRCGWLQDRYGISWQVIPSILPDLMNDPTKAPKATEAFMKMNKFDIQALADAVKN